MSRHIKLPKSSVKDSFKEIALEKKWINPEQIEKKASITDLSLTDSLDANISKLIIGLKDSNLDKFAEEIRYHFLNYKKAENDLYNVTKNEYSKYINLAHPKGSHKMENMEGDAVVEDLYDTQSAILNLLKDKKKVKNANIKKADFFVSKEDKNIEDNVNLNLNSLKVSLQGILSKIKNPHWRDELSSVQELNQTISYVSSLSVKAGWSSDYLKENVSKINNDLSRLPNSLSSLQSTYPVLFNHVTKLIQTCINNISNNTNKIYSPESAELSEKNKNKSKLVELWKTCYDNYLLLRKNISNYKDEYIEEISGYLNEKYFELKEIKSKLDNEDDFDYNNIKNILFKLNEEIITGIEDWQ